MEETDKVVAGGVTEALLAEFYIRESVSCRSTSYILRLSYLLSVNTALHVQYHEQSSACSI